MQEKMNIIDTINVLKRRKTIISVTTLTLFLFSCLVIVYFMSPSYQYSREVLVGGLQQDNTVNGNLQLINSYKDVIKSQIVMETLKKELNLNRSSTDIRNQISVLNNENSQIVSIVVNDQDARLARDIALTVTAVSKEKMKRFTEEDNIQVLNETGIEESASIQFMPTVLGVVLSLIISILAGACLAIIIDSLDDKLNHPKEVEDIFNVPLLGIIQSRLEVEEKRKTDIFIRRESLEFYGKQESIL
ncbi:hypothetical protein JYA63_07690 [Fictibacillus nanhaiensis]|uniref:Polysaccharide chain length determinant N-terminal domain-containing protein n=1 Tax=Fictibacillus nanhaiensis TaxID=742169 RepID=A0ABS2ZMQ5_9BACL|nr:hypothetical protein [Fictibacillus nanhaiensis]